MKIKKMISTMMAVVMTFCVSSIAVKSEEPPASITVNNTTTGTTLEAYQILSYKYVPGVPAAEGKEEIPASFNTVDFTNSSYKKVFVDTVNSNDITMNSTASQIMTHITASNYANDSTFAKTLGEKLHTCIVANNIGATQTKTAEGTSVTFSDLPMGYYLILDKTVYDSNAPKAAEVAVMVQALGRDTNVNLKTSTYTAGSKTASKTNASIGDEIEYTLSFNIPNFSTYAEGANFVITDTMGSGLNFNEVSVTYTLDSAKKELNGASVVPSKDETSGVTTTVITIPVKNFNNADVGKTFKITYKATVNEKAATDNLYNTAVFQQNGNTLPGDDNDKVRVYTYGINVTKVNEVGDLLEGVEFILTNANETVYYTFSADGQFTGTKTDSTLATTLKTDKKGEIKVFGLAAGTYYLKETKELPGYNKLKDLVEVIIEPTIGEAYKADDYSGAYATVKVVNVTGITMPSTGGIGTTAFRAAGGALILVAGAFLILNRKKTVR